MIALKLLPIVQLILLFTDLTTCYPSSFYNSRRLSRAAYRPTYDPYEYYYYTRSQRYPYSYYPTYTQMYPEEYYYNQDAYHMYYANPRTSKYDYYKSALPYYYQDMPLSRNKYNNYYNYQDMSPEDQERLLQELEREEREKSQPIGHEIRYENDEDPVGSIDETNAAFLNNLMMQQMYQDSMKDGSPQSYPYYDQYREYPAEAQSSKVMPRWDDVAYDKPLNLEDEEVEELKALPKKPKNRKNKQRKQRKQQETVRFFENESPVKRSDSDVTVFSDRKPIVKANLPTDSYPIEGSRRDARGQKEEVLMRPATPVRHPFSDSVIQMMQHQEEKKRTPSVYDTIKYMLDMEKKYEEEQKQGKSDLRPSLKKRIVSSEDTLTKQLSVLKKAQ
ncbi:uncharacterized protein LOC126737862 [Anthonomus grandis grandis]|uniref:uncharacterized protein LOC126737862 n=1 Tax=Anthonomus grandis grandis TaxID=2921223 RepID=UPI0021666955|nr:uncharacterized protein LOC126737862 [Anthonomus grandis grandis]